jgi:hypothetical protein
VRSIILMLLPINRANSKVEIPAARASAANVWRRQYGPRLLIPAASSAGIPVAGAPSVEADVPTPRRREEQRRVQPRRQRLQRLQRPSGQRDPPGGRVHVRSGQAVRPWLLLSAVRAGAEPRLLPAQPGEDPRAYGGSAGACAGAVLFGVPRRARGQTAGRLLEPVSGCPVPPTSPGGIRGEGGAEGGASAGASGRGSVKGSPG